MATNIRKKVSKYFLIIGTLVLVSCSSSERTPELSIESVTIIAEPDANQNSATAVDLVIIYNEDLEKALGQMSADKYFSSSKQLLLDNPSLLEVWHWELIPGQLVQNFRPDQEEGDAYAAYVFANYITPGDHRVKVPPDGIVKILLQRNDLKSISKSKMATAQLGATASSTVPETNFRKTCKGKCRDEDECEGAESETLPCGIKLGPATCPPQPQPDPTYEMPCPRPISQQKPCAREKPISITTRALAPPPASICQPHHNKVPYGTRKY